MCEYNKENGIFIDYYSASNAVQGNICRYNGVDGILVSGYAYGDNISGNSCRSNTNYGIACYQVTAMSICGNYCGNNGVDGIRLNQSDNCILSNNVSIYNGVDGTGYGIAIVNSECDNNIVVGNQLHENPSGSLQDLSGGDTIKANNYP